MGDGCRFRPLIFQGVLYFCWVGGNRGEHVDIPRCFVAVYHHLAALGAGPDSSVPKQYPQHSQRQMLLFKLDDSGQIIATSHDLTPNGGLVGQTPLFQGI